jgi:hypothetical protein
MKPTLYGLDSNGERRAMQPVPTRPTDCQKCGSPLERLRRYAGLCRACVLSFAHAASKSTAHIEPQFRVLQKSHRVRPDGRRERYVLVQCTCGQRRTLKWTTWQHHRPRCCNRCRLRAIDALGFEAEYGR